MGSTAGMPGERGTGRRGRARQPLNVRPSKMARNPPSSAMARAPSVLLSQGDTDYAPSWPEPPYVDAVADGVSLPLRWDRPTKALPAKRGQRPRPQGPAKNPDAKYKSPPAVVTGLVPVIHVGRAQFGSQIR